MISSDIEEATDCVEQSKDEGLVVVVEAFKRISRSICEPMEDGNKNRKSGGVMEPMEGNSEKEPLEPSRIQNSRCVLMEEESVSRTGT